MYRQQSLQHGFEQIQPQRIRPVALRLRRVIVHLKEHPIHARRHRCPRQHGNELRLPAAHPAGRARLLHAVVPSNTTGANSRIAGRLRKSTTSVL